MADRTKYSEQAKVRLLKDFRKSKLTAREFCRQQGIATSTFSYWKRVQAARRNIKPGPARKDGIDNRQLDFIPVALIEPKSGVALAQQITFKEQSGHAAIEVALSSGSLIRFDANCPPSLVTAAFTAIGGQ